MGSQTEGASKTVFAPTCTENSNWRSLKNGLHQGFPRPLFVPVIAMIRGSGWFPERLLSHQPGRGVAQQVPPPPHPGSVSQAKSPLDKLSPRASRKPVYILSYWHRSSHQPPRAGTPPSPLFLHHRAMSTMLQVRGWSPPPCNVVSSCTLIHRPAHVQQ